jgi:hypothetical protein
VRAYAFKAGAPARGGKASLHIAEALAVLADHKAERPAPFAGAPEVPQQRCWNWDASPAFVGPAGAAAKAELAPILDAGEPNCCRACLPPSSIFSKVIMTSSGQ